MSKEPINVLVVAPHHDDDIMGCGGTMAKLHKQGKNVYVAYMTAGWSGIPNVEAEEKAVEIRENEAREACRILGVADLFFLREKDRSFIYNSKVLDKLIKIIRQVKPNVIYTPHPAEKDLEHRVTYEVTKEASWLSKNSYLPKLGDPVEHLESIRLYEVWTPMQSYFIKEDITDVFDEKMKALSAHKSQTEYLNLVDAITGLNVYRGSMVGVGKRYAEVFQVEKT